MLNSSFLICHYFISLFSLLLLFMVTFLFYFFIIVLQQFELLSKCKMTRKIHFVIPLDEKWGDWWQLLIPLSSKYFIVSHLILKHWSFCSSMWREMKWESWHHGGGDKLNTSCSNNTMSVKDMLFVVKERIFLTWWTLHMRHFTPR